MKKKNKTKNDTVYKIHQLTAWCLTTIKEEDTGLHNNKMTDLD